MSEVIIDVGTFDLLSRLGRELVVSYKVEDANIASIVTDLLGFQVLTPAITVGTIDAAYSELIRSISVEGDTILKALLRLREGVGGFIEVDVNRKFNWLASIGENKGQQIRYRKNLLGITRETDYLNLCNHLYAFGSGRGDARVKLSDVVGHTTDFIEDVGSQTMWGGIYPRIIINSSINNADTLMAWAQRKLAELKDPRITYNINTINLAESLEVDFSFETLRLGSIVTIIDEDLGIDVTARVVRIVYPDMLHPEVMEIEISIQTQDILDILVDIHDMQEIAQNVAERISIPLIDIDGDIVPITDDLWSFGSAFKKWREAHIDKVFANVIIIADGAGNYLKLPSLTTIERDGLIQSPGMLIWNSNTLQIERSNGIAWGAVAGGITKLSELEIDTNKDWLTFIINNLGGLQPRTGTLADLGASGTLWREAHINKVFIPTRLRIPVGVDMFG